MTTWRRKVAYRFARWRTGLLLNFGLKSHLLRHRSGSRIFVLHGIFSREHLNINSRFVSRQYFESLLEMLSRFHVLSLDDFYAAETLDRRFQVALTFDDGYLNNFQWAVPLLEQYKLPATFFITPIQPLQDFLWPDLIDLASKFSKVEAVWWRGKQYMKNGKGTYMHAGSTLKEALKKGSFAEIRALQDQFQNSGDDILNEENGEYWKLMDQSQIRYLANHPLFEVGAHGLTHSDLIHLNESEAKEEISKSKQGLEDICGRTIDAFAFPFGDYSRDLIHYCRSVGFKKILLVDVAEPSISQMPEVQARMVSNPHISLVDQMACLLKGSYY